MSIILKGIDMPSKIDLDFHDNHIVLGGVLYPIDIDQLVYIPTPHGRLIDVSKLDKCWEEKEDISEDADYKILYKCVLAISKYAPTILEAEE